MKRLLIPTLPKFSRSWTQHERQNGLRGGSEGVPVDGAAMIGWWLSLPGASGRPDAPCTGANGACSWTGSLLRPVSAGRTLGSTQHLARSSQAGPVGSLRSSFQGPWDTGAHKGRPSGSSDGQSVHRAPAVPSPRCSLLHVALSPALRLCADFPLSRDPPGCRHAQVTAPGSVIALRPEQSCHVSETIAGLITDVRRASVLVGAVPPGAPHATHGGPGRNSPTAAGAQKRAAPVPTLCSPLPALGLGPRA